MDLEARVAILSLTIEGPGPGRPKKGEIRSKKQPPKARSGPMTPEAKRESSARHREKRRLAGTDRRHRLKRYGLTEQAFDAMLASQDHRCPLCTAPISEATNLAPKYFGLPGTRRVIAATTVTVDHCHKTGKVRGLLCTMCNRALGWFKDDPDRLRRAATYLEQHQ